MHCLARTTQRISRDKNRTHVEICVLHLNSGVKRKESSNGNNSEDRTGVEVWNQRPHMKSGQLNTGKGVQ